MEKRRLALRIPKNYLSDAYGILRTNLLYINDLQVIGVTSTQPKDGKTVTSFNIAKSFAELGKKVVLIDGDLRKASLKHYFATPSSTKGLSEVLSRQTTECIYETEIDHLDVILSGKKPPNPTELMSSKEFELLISELRKSYDYIIIDTPPVGVAGDTTIIGKKIDGMLLVVRSEQTKRKNFIRAKKILNRAQIRIIGAVFNGVKKSSVDYDYGLGYGYSKEAQ